MQTNRLENTSNLSNRRLWEILGQADESWRGPRDRALAEQARRELLARNQYHERCRWHATR